MTVFSFGDSYTFGYDLSDFNGSTPSNKTYAALTANALNADHRCYACGSYANNAITRELITHFNEIKSSDIVLIMWTFPSRREFLFDGELGYRSVTPSWQHEFAKIFYTQVDSSESYHVSDTLKEIYIAQQLLNSKQIPYIFASAVTGLSRVVATKDVYNSLIDFVDLEPWLFFENNLGFDDWAKNVLKLKYNGHPPDLAHRALSDLILNKINAK